MEPDRETRTRARELARYALINELRRRPFKRDDLTKSGLLGNHTRQFDKLLEICNKELASVFGMELIEMRSRGLNAEQVEFKNEIQRQALKNLQAQTGDPTASPSKTTKAKGGSTRQYILRSRLNPSLISKIGQIVDDEVPEDDSHEDQWAQQTNAILDWEHGDELGQLGLLGFVLALILMHGRSIDNRQLLIYLKRLKIQESWKPPSTPASAHPPVTLEALLSQFSRQGYLECTQPGTKAGAGGPSQANVKRRSQIGSSEGSQNLEWRWGARAEIEFGEKQIAEFMSDVYRSAKTNVADPSLSGPTPRAPDGSKRRSENDHHDKLMKDIAKAAGSELQDSSVLRMAGRTSAPADVEVAED